MYCFSPLKNFYFKIDVNCSQTGLIVLSLFQGNLLEESNKRLSEAENQIKKQEHQLIEQQIKIEELNRALKVNNPVCITDLSFVVVCVCPLTLLFYV